MSARWFVLLGFAAALMLQADHHNLFTGQWKLNTAKSKFQSPATKAMSLDCTEETCKVDETRADGTRVQWSHSAKPGKETAVQGLDKTTLSTRQINERTIEHTWKMDKDVSKGTGVMSTDGKVMTYTYTGKTPDGKAFKDVMIFEKQ